MKKNLSVRNNAVTILVALVLFLLCGQCLGDTTVRKNQAGEFDYYIIAISWQPAFCQLNQKKTECRVNQGMGENDFVIHGLWPSRLDDKHHRYGYCGVDGETVAKDKHHQWCDIVMDKPDADLVKWMPGVASCLHGHEWVKHGVCSGLASKVYFDLAVDLVKGFAQTSFANYIRQNTRMFLSKGQLLQQWRVSFGSESVAPEFVCRKDKHTGRKLLSEIRIALNKTVEVTRSISARFENQLQVRGSCGNRIYIDAPGYSD